ncbi:MAG: ANTAR domain-containing protein [Gammaproteobacteria bacterium]|jgi:response regulator NasT
MNAPPKLTVLVVDENTGRSAMLKEAIEEAGHNAIIGMDSTDALSNIVARLSPDVIIIDIESPDRDTLEQMRTISRDNPKPVVMFSDDNKPETIKEAIKAGVSAYVIDGLNDKRIKSLMDVAIARFREYQSLKDELNQVKNNLEERKIIDRAKGILMNHKHCSENEAYQLLRKSAMQSNQRMVQVARNLIASIDLLS